MALHKELAYAIGSTRQTTGDCKSNQLPTFTADQRASRMVRKEIANKNQTIGT